MQSQAHTNQRLTFTAQDLEKNKKWVENGMIFHMLSEWYAAQNKRCRQQAIVGYTSQIKC